MKRIIFLMIIFPIALFSNGQQLKIELEGDAVFNHSSLSIGEAGEDFPSGIETESSFYLSVLYTDDFNKKKNPNTKWNIKVFKSDLNWDNRLNLQAKRTGSGDKVGGRGQANIQNGENYQEITNTSTDFFRGKNEITYIPISLKLNGLSVILGAETFETSIVFTVYDEW